MCRTSSSLINKYKIIKCNFIGIWWNFQRSEFSCWWKQKLGIALIKRIKLAWNKLSTDLIPLQKEH
jgi:hypothetical protein